MRWQWSFPSQNFISISHVSNFLSLVNLKISENSKNCEAPNYVVYSTLATSSLLRSRRAPQNIKHPQSIFSMQEIKFFCLYNLCAFKQVHLLGPLVRWQHPQTRSAFVVNCWPRIPVSDFSSPRVHILMFYLDWRHLNDVWQTDPIKSWIVGK